MAETTDYEVAMAFSVALQEMVFDPVTFVNPPGESLPNDGSVKPDNYIQVFYIPNNTLNSSFGDDAQQHRGLIQVSIYWRSGEGYGQPLKVAGQIIDQFHKTKTIFRNGLKIIVDTKPWVSAPIQEDDRVQIPVNISWHVFA